jgi:hypothetical protein
LQKILRGPSRTGLAIVGVCLDTDAKAVNRFIVEHKIAWPQIFFEDKLGWDNPIVSYYGVTEIPALWLIDQSGNVVSTTLTVETLAAELDRVISAGSTKDKSATKVSSDGGEEEESILERHPKGKTAPKKSAPADESSEVPKDE